MRQGHRRAHGGNAKEALGHRGVWKREVENEGRDARAGGRPEKGFGARLRGSQLLLYRTLHRFINNLLSRAKKCVPILAFMSEALSQERGLLETSVRSEYIYWYSTTLHHRYCTLRGYSTPCRLGSSSNQRQRGLPHQGKEQLKCFWWPYQTLGCSLNFNTSRTINSLGLHRHGALNGVTVTGSQPASTSATPPLVAHCLHQRHNLSHYVVVRELLWTPDRVGCLPPCE